MQPFSHNLRLLGYDPERDSLRYLDSYVPAWLIADHGYCLALQQRIHQLMLIQDYEVHEVGEPFEANTPDAPVPPGMTVVRVVAWIREFDVAIPFTEEETV